MIHQRNFPYFILLIVVIGSALPSEAQPKHNAGIKENGSRVIVQPTKGLDEPNGIEATSPAPPIDPIKGVYDYVQQAPSFNGDLDEYLKQNLRYPDAARESGMEGRVIVSFIVHKDGAITDVRAARSDWKQLEEEALRIVRSMPKWNPGLIDGKPVNVYWNLPIKFSLR